MKIHEILKHNTMVYFLGIKIIKYRDLFRVNMLKKYGIKKRMKYISKIYKKRVGDNLDWNNLVSYTEKMQWVKLFDATDEKTRLSDKIEVRSWVADRIGEKYLIPSYGFMDSFDEIDFGSLPQKFVIKVNNGSGTNIIVKDKNDLNLKIAKARIDYWLSVDRSYIKGFELHYSKIKPRILIEKFIEYDGDDLPDYKFLCFNGEVRYCWVDVGRYHTHKRNIYDLEWNLQNWNQYDYGNSSNNIPKPENFNEMIELASKLCQGFSHVRVDLYNINGDIFFGEMTFTNGSGFEKITPNEANIMLGKLWDLDTSNIPV